MTTIVYRTLPVEEITASLFSPFIRRQEVTKCWRKINGNWCIRDDPFIDDWSEEDRRTLAACLQNTAETGGLVLGAFSDGVLKGIVSVESERIGKKQNYLDLSCIHVSADMRRAGIGKKLFFAAKDWAREHGAEKLYISAHSAVESQSFYRAMGCTEAEEYQQKHAEKEPYDCQLECRL